MSEHKNNASTHVSNYFILIFILPSLSNFETVFKITDFLTLVKVVALNLTAWFNAISEKIIIEWEEE